MSYTINKLAKISGVSVRTLHWYDQIGLLTPAFVKENGYRYYEETELLRLQQILFFRELGFKLSDVQKLLLQSDFDNIKALSAHRQHLENEIIRKHNLINTIDKTMQHLKKGQNMREEELYYGFDERLPKSNQYTCVDRGSPAEKMLAYFKKDDVVWTDQQWASFKDEVDLLDKALAKLIAQGDNPDSTEVQALMAKHYEKQSNFFNLTRDAYFALMQLYADDQGTIKMFFDVYHPQMQDFIVQAMQIYADKNL